MASTSGRRRRRSVLPIDDLVSSYNKRRGNMPPHSDLPNYVDSGDSVYACIYCGALFWLAEKSVNHSRKHNPVYTRCCKLGKVVLPNPPSSPSTLIALYSDRNFRENIRAYNALFAMTSFGAKVDNTVNDGFGPYTFKISGQVSHWIGTMCPDPNTAPRFLQLYIYDPANEVSNRLSVYSNSNENGLNPDIVGFLTHLLGSINKYVRMFKTAKNIADEKGLDDYAVRLYNNVADSRYNVPECDMVGGIVSGDDSNATSFDVIVYSKSGHPHRVSKLHPSYMPLQYPLIFPHGQPGWSPYLKLTSDDEVSSKSLTINMYYCYLCHDRQSVYSLIVNSGRLFQQFLVDSYVCVEESRLDYIRTHQNELRSEYVSGVYDALSRGDSDGRSIGKRVFLPSSFVGGPRYMYSHYQDALAISRVYGNPQYFITFTCNVGWSEIRRFMAKHHVSQTHDRPDILSRIFRIKVLEFIAFLKSDKLFGDISACKYSLKFFVLLFYYQSSLYKYTL